LANPIIEPEGDDAPLVDLDRRARRFETAGMGGPVVWRTWGNGPPLLLAHGAQGAWSHWIRNIDELAETRTVWAVDLPASGDSARAEAKDHVSISATLATGLRELVGARPIDLVGFSFGGVTLAHLAAYHPELARRLILIGTGGLGTAVGKVEMKSVRKLQGEKRKEAHRFNLLGLMLHKDVDELAIEVQESNVFRSRLDAIGLVLPDKLAAILPRVRAPYDAIWGEYDRPHPPEPQEPVLRQIQPNMNFRVIADAGHWVMYERPDAFNQALLEMLNKPPRAAL
jgi:pimeloyl-ACP methyl ester carboxylesterase